MFFQSKKRRAVEAARAAFVRECAKLGADLCEAIAARHSLPPQSALVGLPLFASEGEQDFMRALGAATDLAASIAPHSSNAKEFYELIGAAFEKSRQDDDTPEPLRQVAVLLQSICFRLWQAA